MIVTKTVVMALRSAGRSVEQNRASKMDPNNVLITNFESAKAVQWRRDIF